MLYHSPINTHCIQDIFQKGKIPFRCINNEKILLLHLMFKFNPVKHKINILKEIADDKFKVDLSKDTNESSNPSASDQFNTIIVNSFCSNYKIRTINKLSQSLNFEVIKIIESSLSIHYNQFYKVTSPENLIIGLHYRGYSASDIEIKYPNYLYSIFQFLQTTSTSLNSEDYKTPKGNHVLKQDYSSAIENIDSYLIYEFQSLQATKTNDADLFNCITFRMNEINMLYDTIENIKLQLKELRVLVEASVKESEDLPKKFAHSEEDLEKDLKSLHVDHCQFKEEWTLLNKNRRVENDKIRKEFDDLDNFYKFGERIIINRGVHCINGVRA
ncbi:hypothetical protein C2G38_2234706 [Gigaspora rosea]|uniref:Uncharacterized protein n=1 Tax=Gigaspora rosea TaxID=44941 RepID=A0A397TTT6_9GLOM|nr:hypothetical protein C2G38_2234706 [Gigaspora rosea]CAG8441999.1 10247_t:CDS:1 [Gigaspora rosea]